MYWNATNYLQGKYFEKIIVHPCLLKVKKGDRYSKGAWRSMEQILMLLTSKFCRNEYCNSKLVFRFRQEFKGKNTKTFVNEASFIR